MLRRNGLACLFLADFVRLAAQHADELDATVDKEVTGFAGEGHAGGGREDLGDDFLDRRCGDCVSIGNGVVVVDGVDPATRGSKGHFEVYRSRGTGRRKAYLWVATSRRYL